VFSEQVCARNTAVADKRLMTEWVLSDIIGLKDNSIKVVGHPRTIDSQFGKAILFNGKKDGIFFKNMPLSGLEQFTIEVIFRPDYNGKFEQRFFHSGEVYGERVLLETRTTSTDWYLDAYIKSGNNEVILIDSNLVHPLGQWYNVAFVIDKGKLATYVNGIKELEGQLDLVPILSGKTSVGVRQNKLSWFRGAIYKIRISPKALEPDYFMKFQ